MQYYLVLVTLFTTLYAPAQSLLLKDLIKDPIVSRRCKALIRDRNNKVKIKQRLNSMLVRNRRLQKSLKKTQKLTRKRLELNEIQLRNNFRLTQLKVTAMEENIIRKGCPGITL